MPPKFPLYLTACIFMLCGYVLQGQTIDAPTVSGTPVCAGSTVSISFKVTNGSTGNTRFSTNTDYIVYLGTESNYRVIQTFKSQTAPRNRKSASAIITRLITIPADTPNNTGYRIGILSQSPAPSPNVMVVSSTFKVGENASGANQATAGNNNWTGHFYNDIFGTYLGNYTKTEAFDESFGGSGCFAFSGAVETGGVVNTETFSVRYRMNSSRSGLYTVNLGSDDGSRLSNNGSLIYNDWSIHDYKVNANVLLTLSGSNNLVMEYYENTGDNRISISAFRTILLNNLIQNVSQAFLLGGTGLVIGGDTYATYGTLPPGISLTGTGYQWSFSTTPGGTRTNITGATRATFTPNSNAAPFNAPGTYYLYRQGALTSTNNTGITSYQATHVSNMATVTVSDPNACGYSNNTFNDISHSPCINYANPQHVIMQNMAVKTYFVMDVIKGLTYQIYTGNTTAPSNQLSLSVYRDGVTTELPITYSSSNTGNPATIVNNNAFVSFISTFSGRVRVLLNDASNCTATTPANILIYGSVKEGTNTQDDQFASDMNSWVGHLYDGVNYDVPFNGNFSNYLGYYTQLENFDQSFGGADVCFPVFSNGVQRGTVFNETFSIRYRMKSSLRGLYTVNIGSDDGSRLSVNGSLVYNDWGYHAYTLNSNILIGLTGNNNLVLDYFEEGGDNRISISRNAIPLILNELTVNINQTITEGNDGNPISGDIYEDYNTGLPAGITRSNTTGYQWSYSTTPGGTRTNIPGATGSTFTPTINSAVDSPGTYYIYRNAILSSTNNKGITNYIATNESNAATLIVLEEDAYIAVHPQDQNVCAGTSANFSVEAVGSGLSYQWEINTGAGWSLLPNEGNYSGTTTSSLAVNNAQAEMDNYQFRVIVTKGSTEEVSSAAVLQLIKVFTWTGATSTDWNTTSNWGCNTLPTITSNVIIPEGLNRYPLLNAGNDGLARNITIEKNASVEVEANKLHIGGSITNSGALNVKNGSVLFVGEAPQTIPLGAFLNNQIQNLYINNSTGVTSQTVIELTGVLKVVSGSFNTGGNFTLISSAEKTALIDGSGNGEVTGSVHMQRYLEPAFGYKYFSSPFSGSRVGDFTDIDLTAAFPAFYRYNENRRLNREEEELDATGWEAYTDPASALHILEGYALNFGASTDASLVELTGLVNNGSYNRILENNNRNYTKGFHLVGNPYPSPVDWDLQDGWIKNKIDNGIYFFTAGETQYTGTYTSYVNGISSEDGKASSIIPSMQGFFVKVSDPADGVSKVSGSLGINNKSRTLNFDQKFLKSRETIVQPLLRLTAAYEGSGKKDTQVLYFTPNAGLDFEKQLDAHKILNTDPSVPSFYSISRDNKILSINALPLPGTGSYEKVSLGIIAVKQGKITINLSEVPDLPRHLNIYLIDNEKRIGQNLSNRSSYTFDIKEGEHNSRFQLLFSEDKITDLAIAFDDKFSVDSSGDYLKVRLNLEDSQKGILRVSTITGQLLEVKEGRGKEEVKLGAVTSAGMYFISLYVDGKIYSKKLLKQ